MPGFPGGRGRGHTPLPLKRGQAEAFTGSFSFYQPQMSLERERWMYV
jgi:hypothetical protein